MAKDDADVQAEDEGAQDQHEPEAPPEDQNVAGSENPGPDVITVDRSSESDDEGSTPAPDRVHKPDTVVVQLRPK